MLHGAVVSVPSVFQVAPPAGVAAKTTFAAPVPLTVAFSVTLPEITPPGFASVTVGAVTSTVNVTMPPVKVFPARSVITGRRSQLPLETVVASHVALNGALVADAIWVKAPPPVGRSS